MSKETMQSKEISYNGGLITFNVPQDWIEEYDQQGGGTFYEDSPASGTFRLHVITLQSQASVTKSEVVNVLQSVGKIGDPVSTLPNGTAYKTFSEKTQDSGQDITIYYWSLAQIIEPNHARIANFSYTVLSSQVGTTRHQEEIDYLLNSIRNAKFSPELESGI
ncbi:hypothetical protein [Enterovibrio baiacu]|uniref:hypothetical protein n=1 Tax=Enterovibrio baiacu TaxID=2491023 RepID=UPI003D0E8B9E